MSKKLFKSTSLIAVITLISRVSGFVRDVVMAQVFGAGATFDAFVIAFKIPNFLRRIFGEGAFSQAFVPLLAEYRAKRTYEETRLFLDRVAGNLIFMTSIVVVVAEIIAPLIIMIFAPGFLKDPERYHLATNLLRITFPYLIFITLTAFSGAILNTYGRFGNAAFAPIMLNIAMIAVAWFWAPHAQVPIYTLAWGVLIGGVLQLLVTAPFLMRMKIMPLPKISWSDPGVRRVLKLMIPALFGVSVAQISLIIDSFFASFLPEGSISWLYYSDRFTYLPLGVFGMALATVVMPHLSGQHSKNETRDFSNTLDWALRCVLIVGIPAAVALFILSGPLLATLIEHGAFSQHDVIMTKRSLMAFAVGLPGFMLVKILASAFYARQDIKTPVKIAVIAVGVSIILNVLLIFPLKHAGLALATALAAIFNSAWLLRGLLRDKIYSPLPNWGLFLLRLLLANLVMGILIALLAGNLQHWFNWTVIERGIHLFIVISVGLVSFLGTLLLSGMRLKDFRPPPTPSS